MASENPLVFRWGIIGTGKISTCFVKDLLVDPKTRQVQDIVHRVGAVGSSHKKEKAQEFIDTVAGGDKSIHACENYDEVYQDKNVDAVYIGTPHAFHYKNALDAIRHGKHVLCEKPVTCNAAEVKSLIAAAREHGVFLMEAMWTRFLPISKAVKDFIDEGSLGKPIVVHADLSGNFDIENISMEHRILDPMLGGGALLDLGPYPLVWAIIALYELPTNQGSPPAVISGSIIKTRLTNVDCNTSFTLSFPNISAQAILSCSINLDAVSPGVIIRFEKGTLEIPPPIYCPSKYVIRLAGEEGKSYDREFKFEGRGWHFQADEVARCVRDAKLESSLWTHQKMVLAMQIFDEVRKQGSYTFPPGVEQVV